MYMGHLKKPSKGRVLETARIEWPGFIVGCVYLHIDNDSTQTVVFHILK